MSELFTRGLAQLKAGNVAEAQKLFNQDEERAGTAAQTREQLKQAEGKLAAGQVAEAAPLYEKLLERNPGLPEIYLGLVRISLFTQQLDAARTHATAALRVGPKLAMAWAMRGVVFEADGDAPKAIEHLRKAAELEPGSFLAQFNLGRVLAGSGKAAEAIEPLTRATTIDPKSVAAFSTLGIAHKLQRQFEKAVKAFEQAKDLAPKDPDGYATLGDVLFEVKEFAAARAILDQGLGKCGDSPVLLEKALAATMMLDDPSGAIAYVERELKLVPKFEQGWINLANLTLLVRDVKRSEQAAREAIKLNPKNWEAYFHLGNLFDAVPLEKEAEEAYRKAIELAPDNWKPLTNLAQSLLQTQAPAKHAEALTLLEKATKLTPAGEWRVHYNLALALHRAGKRDRALELARKIQQEAAPADPMVAEAKKLESNLLEKR